MKSKVKIFIACLWVLLVMVLVACAVLSTLCTGA